MGASSPAGRVRTPRFAGIDAVEANKSKRKKKLKSIILDLGFFKSRGIVCRALKLFTKSRHCGRENPFGRFKIIGCAWASADD
jgi:hypothetical protein